MRSGFRPQGGVSAATELRHARRTARGGAEKSRTNSRAWTFSAGASAALWGVGTEHRYPAPYDSRAGFFAAFATVGPAAEVRRSIGGGAARLELDAPVFGFSDRSLLRNEDRPDRRSTHRPRRPAESFARLNGALTYCTRAARARRPALLLPLLASELPRRAAAARRVAEFLDRTFSLPRAAARWPMTLRRLAGVAARARRRRLLGRRRAARRPPTMAPCSTTCGANSILHYSYFAVAQVNWDSLGAHYRPIAVSAPNDVPVRARARTRCSHN